MFKTTAAILSILGLIIACQNVQTTPKAQSKDRQSAEWKARMHELSTTVATLLPLTFSESEFADPKNKSKITKQIAGIERLAHRIEDQSDEDIVYNDPSLEVLAGGFEEEIVLTREAFASGHTDYARHKMRDALSYCIQCHTQNSDGAHFMALDLGSQIDSMSLMSQAEFFAATRQFARALDTYKAVLSGKGELSPLEWEKASLHALAIAVRYLRSPEQALQVVDVITKDRSTPYYVRKDAKAWRRALTQWQQELSSEQSLENEDLTRKAQDILQKSGVNGEEGLGAENASAISLLRSSALLHRYLAKPRSPEETAKALLLLGRSYAGVRQFNLSNLEEQFYEKCINTHPHSPTAKKCFARYRDKILIGFSGSGGLVLPKDVEMRMNRLKNLAATK